MVYDLKYGTLRDLIENNKFNPHETYCSRAIIELCGTFNEVVTKSRKPRHIVSVLLDYKDRKPTKLSETTVDNLERICLVMYDKFGGGFSYISKENLLESGKIPYRVDWVKNVKLEDLSRWQHFGLGGNEFVLRFVLRDYPDTPERLLTCRNLRTHNDVKFEKDIIVEQLYFD